MNADADEPIFAAARSEPFTRDDGGISARDFKESFGEEIRATLDLASWRIGTDVEQEYRRLEREVKDAVHRETKLQAAIRSEIFPRLKTQPKGPKNAGVHTADPATLARIHKEFLFNGGVEACDGAIEIHNTLPLTIYQIGVTLVSYQGDQGTWSQRLFRRDLQQSFENRLDAVMASLERRQNRAESGEGLGELVQKALLDWAERAILLKRATAPWRMGHGNPITYELLTGGGNLELMVEGTNILRELIESHQKFVFVSEEPRDELLLTIGHALRPMEFAIVSTLDDRLEHWLHQKRFAANNARVKWDGESIPCHRVDPALHSGSRFARRGGRVPRRGSGSATSLLRARRPRRPRGLPRARGQRAARTPRRAHARGDGPARVSHRVWGQPRRPHPERLCRRGRTVALRTDPLQPLR